MFSIFKKNKRKDDFELFAQLGERLAERHLRNKIDSQEDKLIELENRIDRMERFAKDIGYEFVSKHTSGWVKTKSCKTKK